MVNDAMCAELAKTAIASLLFCSGGDTEGELKQPIHAQLTLCRSYLNPYCLGRKTEFFSVGI
jgi:hypothetical protein